MAVYGYCRVSTVRQVEDGLSLEVQRRQVEGYAQMHGLALARVFLEQGVSGSVPLGERPAGRELVAALQPGDAVIAAKLDRLVLKHKEKKCNHHAREVRDNPA